jgi:hypothetical protein
MVAIVIGGGVAAQGIWDLRSGLSPLFELQLAAARVV